MTDLNKALVRSAPRVPVPLTVEPADKNYPVSVDVIEPDDTHPLPALPAPTLRSVPFSASGSSAEPHPLSSTYRIPRSVPAPTPAPRVYRLSKKKAAVLADKVAKREAKQRRKVEPRKRQYCALCKISCNSRKVYIDHIHSRGHRIRRENAAKKPRCYTCGRDFESHEHLNRHRQGAAHLRVVRNLQSKE